MDIRALSVFESEYGYNAVVNLEKVSDIARRAYGMYAFVGWSHSRPLQYALQRAGYGVPTDERTLKVPLSDMVAFAESLGERHVEGTNMHNHVGAIDVLQAIVMPPKGWRGKKVDWAPALVKQQSAPQGEVRGV